MTPEHRPTPSHEPPTLATALRQLLDDLVTRQEWAESLTLDPAAARLLEIWQQDLARRLSQEIRGSVATVASLLKLMPPGPQRPVTESERRDWQWIEIWSEPFVVASICRADLRGILSDEAIAALDNGDMAEIADRMSDAFRDSGGYWDSLTDIAQRLWHNRQVEPDPVTTGRSDDGDTQQGA